MFNSIVIRTTRNEFEGYLLFSFQYMSSFPRILVCYQEKCLNFVINLEVSRIPLVLHLVISFSLELDPTQGSGNG